VVIPRAEHAWLGWMAWAWRPLQLLELLYLSGQAVSRVMRQEEIAFDPGRLTQDSTTGPEGLAEIVRTGLQYAKSDIPTKREFLERPTKMLQDLSSGISASERNPVLTIIRAVGRWGRNLANSHENNDPVIQPLAEKPDVVFTGGKFISRPLDMESLSQL